MAAIAVLALVALTGSASAAAPYRVLVVSEDCGDDTAGDLVAQIAAQPDVGSVDTFDGWSGTPSLTLLQTYDLVATTAR